MSRQIERLEKPGHPLDGFGGLVRPAMPVRSRRWRDVIGVSSIRDDAAGSNFANDGNLKLVMDTGGGTTITWDAMLYFAQPLLALRGLYLEWNSSGDEPDQDGTVADGDAMPSLTDLNLNVQLVIDDWDPDTVTWNSAAGLTLRNSMTLSHTLTWAGAGTLKAVVGDGDVDVIMEVQQLTGGGAVASELFWYGKDGYKLPTADLDNGKKIYGVRLAINSTSYFTGGSTATGIVKPNTSYTDKDDYGTPFSYAVL